MSIIVTRAVKGSELEWIELDANFINLNTDKVEIAAVDAAILTETNRATAAENLKAPLASPAFTGLVSIDYGTPELPSLAFTASSGTGLYGDATTVGLSQGGYAVLTGTGGAHGLDLSSSSTAAVLQCNTGDIALNSSNILINGLGGGPLILGSVAIQGEVRGNYCVAIGGVAAADYSLTIGLGAYTVNLAQVAIAASAQLPNNNQTSFFVLATKTENGYTTMGFYPDPGSSASIESNGRLKTMSFTGQVIGSCQLSNSVILIAIEGLFFTDTGGAVTR